MQQNITTGPDGLPVFTFHGRSIPAYQWEGAPVFLMEDAGRLMGYSEGKRLTAKVRAEWRAEMRLGEHWHELLGEQKKSFVISNVTDSVHSHLAGKRKIRVLTGQGFRRACLMTRLPIGTELRDWIDGVMKALEKTGRYEIAGHPAIEADTATLKRLASAPAETAQQRETRLRDALNAQIRRQRAKGMRMAASLLEKDGELSVGDALRLRACSMLAGEDFEALRRPAALPAPAPPRLVLASERLDPRGGAHWQSPTTASALLGTTPQMIGKAVVALGLRYIDGMLQWYKGSVGPEGNQREVDMYRLSPSARVKVAEWVEVNG